MMMLDEIQAIAQVCTFLFAKNMVNERDMGMFQQPEAPKLVLGSG